MTLNQIINQLKTFSENHRQINDFFEGDLYEYNNGKNNLYPCMTVVIQPSVLQQGRENFSFQIGFWDKVFSDLSNNTEVLSDTKLMCKDLISFFKKNPDTYDLVLELPVTIETFTEKWDDAVSGSFFNVNFYQAEGFNFCDIPYQSNNYITEDGIDLITEDGKLLIPE